MAVGFQSRRGSRGASEREREREERQPSEGERGQLAEFDTIGADVGEAYDSGRPTIQQLSDALARDPQLQAISQAGTLPLRGLKPRIEAAEGDSGEKEFCEAVLLASASEGGMTTPIGDVVAQMFTSGRDFGSAFFELVVENRGLRNGPDGGWRIHKIAYRPSKTCKVLTDKNGSFNGYQQRGFRPHGGGSFTVEIGPENAFVYFRGGATSPLKGRSAIATAYRAHVDKLKVMTLWREHLQQFALGILVGTMPATTFRDKIKRKIFRNKIRKVRGGGRFVKSEGEGVDMLQGQPATQEFLEKLRYLDRQMAVSVLAPFLTLGDGSTGSWALSRDHSDFYLQSLEADALEAAEALSNHVIAKLVRWNFGADAAFPKLVFETLSDNQQQLARETLEKLYSVLDPPLRRLLEKEALPAMGVDPEDLEEARANADVQPQNAGESGEGNSPVTPPELDGNLAALERALGDVATNGTGG